MTAEEQLGKLGPVRVWLDIEMARTKATIGELARLRPGCVLALPTGPANDLTLKIAGVTVGECEPVCVDRKAAVRITRILRAGEPE